MNDIDHYNGITIDAMRHTLGLYPRPFQLSTISHIIKMRNCPSSIHPIKPSLLVQGTSGGKSSVYQMIGVIKGGITLIIESMLSLSSDQIFDMQWYWYCQQKERFFQMKVANKQMVWLD
jgi:superfamily II DNA helicase RecQ